MRAEVAFSGDVQEGEIVRVAGVVRPDVVDRIEPMAIRVESIEGAVLEPAFVDARAPRVLAEDLALVGVLLTMGLAKEGKSLSPHSEKYPKRIV
jgi:hypothetical protein